MYMKYIVVDSAEFTYPDQMEYLSSSDCVVVDAPRGSYATFQILLSGLYADFCKENWLPESIYNDPALLEQARIGFPRKSNVSVKTDLAFTVEWYSLVPVTIEKNPFPSPEHFRPHFPERIAPYRVYDCLRPFDGTLDVGVGDGRDSETGIGGFYGAIQVPKDAVPGKYSDFINITVGEETISIPLVLNIYKAILPEETLTVIQHHDEKTVAKYHNVEYGSEEYQALDAAYIKALRRMRQNMMAIGGVQTTEVEENKYEFDFSVMEETMRRRLSQGMKCFDGPTIGCRESWKKSTINISPAIADKSMRAMSYEAYLFLSQYLTALNEMLERNGWIDRFVMEVQDEPNAENATEFRALCGLIRKFAPEIRLMDAVNYVEIFGALDILVPLNMEYDKYQAEIETLRNCGGEIWHYVCCGPRQESYINRFIDYALLATRYLFWGNYRYNLSGYLHWAVARYQSGQDPFRLNCPEHRSADNVNILPSGDTHVLYPGEDGPWMSIRAEAQREGIEEYEMLCELAKTDKVKADELCAKVFRSFCDVEYDIKVFRTVRKELLVALSEL